jgi:hypothetical protein
MDPLRVLSAYVTGQFAFFAGFLVLDVEFHFV